jgi:site-specific DNA-methyltransferase (adenine-specific)
LGDCLNELAGLNADQLDAVCTDPPYGMVEFSDSEVAKLRSGKGGVWRIPPKWDGCERKPLPRFSVLSEEQKLGIEDFFSNWGKIVFAKIKPGGHLLIAGNPTLQMYVQQGLIRQGFENRATILRIYHGFRGGDRPKNAEKEFPQVCVSPRGNYEPWMLFRKPISEKTVAQNLRKWGTGGLRMMAGNRPLPDVIPSFKTPQREKDLANHPSLKPQHLLRVFIRALLPMGDGLILDPFMGSGSTIAAALAVGCASIGMEKDEHYFRAAKKSIHDLAMLYPTFKGDSLDFMELNGVESEHPEQLVFLEKPARYNNKR